MKITEYAPKIKCTAFGCDCQTRMVMVLETMFCKFMTYINPV